MAITNNPYTTLANVKEALDPSMDGTNDSFLTKLMAQAQADIDRKIGYAFQQDGTVASPSVHLFDGKGQPQIFVDNLIQITPLPSGAVFEIQKNTYLGSNGIWVSGTILTYDITADIILKPNNTSPKYIVQRQSGLPFEEGIQNYSISGVWGFATVPADIERITTRLTIHYYKMRDTNYADMIQEQGGIRERYSKKMPDDVVEVIEFYRRNLLLRGND